jgi:hypothetical protein
METHPGKDDALHIGEKKEKNNQFSNNLPDQNEYVNYNPKNPVNPDSKPRLKATPKTKTTYR